MYSGEDDVDGGPAIQDFFIFPCRVDHHPPARAGKNSESRRGARQGPLAAARVRSTLLPIDERFGGLVGEPVFGVLP
jgi:hypothetical protein